MPTVRARAADGFTLLEAIVAMVIFSMGAMALYAWLGANLLTLQRVSERRATVTLVSSALDAVRRVNPMETPRGRRDYGDIEVEWESEPVEPPRDSVTQVGLPNLFSVGLYDMQVRVLRDGEEVHRFNVRQLGHEQVREMGLE
ncbi:MAG: prepilin-type N-terminal cleavage/methylation domain-containing protein [Proteobacteria bacterium]|nr:prepilin-type N-terminal cleavage/methylation domain-containing protein [Pseudomonadota bacterium]